MFQEKIKNYKQCNKNEFDLGFDSQKLSYIPGYFSSYINQSRLPNFTSVSYTHLRAHET